MLYLLNYTQSGSVALRADLCEFLLKLSCIDQTQHALRPELINLASCGSQAAESSDFSGSDKSQAVLQLQRNTHKIDKKKKKRCLIYN